MSTAGKVAAFLGANVVSLDQARVARDGAPAELPLGDMPCVVPPKPGRREPVIKPQTTAAFERAWELYARVDAFGRSTRKLSWPKWVAAARVFGEDRLEAAVAAYVRDPRQREVLARSGAPGFQVWLNGGRYERYLDAESPVAVVASRSIPDEVFNAVADRWSVDYAGSWLHGARMSETRPGALVVRTSIAADRLLRECRAELMAVGVTDIAAVRDGRTICHHRLS